MPTRNNKSNRSVVNKKTIAKKKPTRKKRGIVGFLAGKYKQLVPGDVFNLNL